MCQHGRMTDGRHFLGYALGDRSRDRRRVRAKTAAPAAPPPPPPAPPRGRTGAAPTPTPPATRRRRRRRRRRHRRRPVRRQQRRPRRRWPRRSRRRHAAAAAPRHRRGDGTGAPRRSSAATKPTPDPRVGLKAGYWDAAEALWNMRRISTTPPNERNLGTTHSDLAFTGKYAIQGNYNGFQILRHLESREAGSREHVLLPGVAERRVGLQEPAVHVVGSDQQPR